MARSIPLLALLVLTALACAKRPQIIPEQAIREFWVAASREQVVDAANLALRDMEIPVRAIRDAPTFRRRPRHGTRFVLRRKTASDEPSATTVQAETLLRSEYRLFDSIAGPMYWLAIDITATELADGTRVTIVPKREFSVNRSAARHPEPISEMEVDVSARLAKSIERRLSKSNS